MALPTFTGSAAQVKTGPGFILMATYSNIPEDIPVPTAASPGVFTNDWPDVWDLVGYTDAGITLAFDTTTEDVEVAESNYPIKTVSTRSTGTASFAAAQINRTNLARALNGGVWTESGSGLAKVSKYSPPELGKEVRSMLGWIGPDSDEMLIMYKVFQSGAVTIAREKGANKATLSMQFRAEIPSKNTANPLGDVWNYWYAGTWADDNE